MIWVAGQIVRDDALSVSVLDRTFEHGLGLFETFRTWNGHATLLPRHLQRLKYAAADLGLPVPDAGRLPTETDVHSLIAADGREGDALLRITMSGGIPGSSSGSTLWMRSSALPTTKAGGYVIGATWKVPALGRLDDGAAELREFKTLNYWERRRVHENALEQGWDENLAVDAGGMIYEGSRTNVFVVSNGKLLTPPYQQLIVQGIMRELVLELAEWGGRSRRVLDDADLLNLKAIREADEVFLTNSVRGIIPVSTVLDHDESGARRATTFPAPGTYTSRLWDLVRRWLESGGKRLP